ncbi:AAA-like domain-containing protein [Anaerolineales bacterium HSG25]|nr:AAA-like domain-containing protein [Anaerolineales bacterium HSG25]
MRKFSSYGPIDSTLNYHVPRTELIDFACNQLLGENFERGGHYITVWAPRQRGKSWTMQQVLWRLMKDDRVDVLKINLEHLKFSEDVSHILQVVANEITKPLQLPSVSVNQLDDFYTIFEQNYLKKPFILILDEFDALHPDAISGMAGVFRNIYNQRKDSPLPSADKPYLLHGVALIGVRAVLSVENVTGSPFNVQRSVHIPNLTYEEVDSMFHWYERESGQTVNQDVIDRVFYETQGQPGLTSWLGELLTETYNEQTDQPISMKQFGAVYGRALKVLPNNNILNIISKTKQEPYKQLVLELFKTNRKLKFRYDNPVINFLYMNGVVDFEQTMDGIEEEYYTRFPCPFVQKRLFNYFADTIFEHTGRLHDPFDDLADTITDEVIIVPNLLKRYEIYLAKNRHWLLKNAPRRREDLRIYEAVYHFNFYMYLAQFFQEYPVRVNPEFPTGNGKIDLLIDYEGIRYGLEVKSFGNQRAYKKGLVQAANYGHSLGLSEIWLVLFIEAVDEVNQKRFEVGYTDPETGVQVHPQFVQIGVDEQALS